MGEGDTRTMPTPTPVAEAAFLTDRELIGEIHPRIARLFKPEDTIKELAAGLFRILGGSSTVRDHCLIYAHAFKPIQAEASTDLGDYWQMICLPGFRAVRLDKGGWRTVFACLDDLEEDASMEGGMTVAEFLNAARDAMIPNDELRPRKKPRCTKCHLVPCECC